MSTITIKEISKSFGDVEVLKPFTETFKDGEFITLLGPSGCGKTTMLRLIAGFEKPTSGEILIGDKVVSGGKTFLPPEKRGIGMVFQSYAVWPHMNVFDNVAYPLKIAGVKKEEIKERVEKVLEIVHLSQYKDREPSELSGGQQQRVALGRALISRPKLLLLDEPLSNLDAKLREEMRFEIKEIQKRLGITVVYVTHDQEEALTMSDTIVVMNDGKIQQIGTPIDIYNEPKNAFIASFIGESNILDGIMNEDFLVSFSGRKFKCVDKGFALNEEIDVVIRPEDLELVDEEDGMLVGIVKSEIFKGVHYELLVKVGDFDYMVHSTITKPIGSKVGLKVTPDNIHIMKKGAKEV